MRRDTAGSVRIFNLARGLASAGNVVKVIIPRDKAATEFVDGVTVHSFRGLIPRTMLEVLRKIVNIGRPTSIYAYDFLFVFRVSRLIRETDLVQIEQQSSGGLLIPFIKKILKRPVVVDCHDVFQALRLHHTSMLRRMFETFLERLAYKNADLLLVVSETEKRRLITAGFKKCQIEVIPNGVDTKAFTKSSMQIETRKKYGLENSRTVTFMGNLEYSPNREAVNVLSSVIAPRVLNEIQDAQFLVIGRRRDQTKVPGLIFTGFVDDVSALLSITDVGVAPLLHGSGTRLKVLEYLSCGLPVVSTSVGAEGLDIENGANIFIEDDFDSFALRVVELLRNKDLSSSVGKAARALVSSAYDWSHITQKLEIALNHLLSQNDESLG